MTASYDSGRDLCLSFWAEALDKAWIYFPQNARVLEIGCAEADWQTPMLAMRPDLQIVGVDWREVQRPGVQTIKGNIMDGSLFEPETFDAVVSISAIEHVGLGAYNKDPLDARGDMKAMQNAYRWTKPGGWMYLDVPFAEHGPMLTYQNYRRYNDQSIADRLLQGFKPGKAAKCVCGHPDSPYMALLLRKV
jgi:cyclopropane fatty-acyl-phospholipid synthase-like methyltransferase